jgi:hypothetical protein
MAKYNHSLSISSFWSIPCCDLPKKRGNFRYRGSPPENTLTVLAV